MKVKMIRASGNPVVIEKMKAKQDEWQKGFDSLIEEHGKYGPEISKALDSFEAELGDKYNDLTIHEVSLPSSGKEWLEMVTEYGNVMLTTSVEDSKDVKAGDLILVINDMVF